VYSFALYWQTAPVLRLAVISAGTFQFFGMTWLAGLNALNDVANLFRRAPAYSVELPGAA
jgi:hypothetical protein